MDTSSVAALGVIVLATAYAFARRALVSLVYGVAILAVYALEVASAGGPFVLASPLLGDLGLRFGPGVWPAPWTWITFEFVHASETHVLLNLLGLILISPGFEERIGGVRWAVLFFAGGAFGAGVFLAVHAGASTVLVGASAGILAAFGAYGRLFPRERVTLFLPIPGVPSLPIAQVVLGYLILEMALSLFGARGVAWEAHVGGIAFGFAARRRNSSESWRKRSAQTCRRHGMRGSRSSSRARGVRGAGGRCGDDSAGSRARAAGVGRSEAATASRSLPSSG